jgi:putative heme-binding domain-containing protein
VAAEALARVKELFKEDPEDQNTYYGLIACAARSNEARKDALELLKKWPVDDKALKEMPEKEDDQVAFWEKVYQKNYPNDKRSFPVFSGEGYQDPAKFQKLAEFIKSSSPEKTGNAEAGKTLYTTAKCINCHAFKGAGKQLGPELTDVSKRFEQSKILDDLIYPSKIVDTRYKQVLFATKDGQRISGFVSAETDDALSVTNAEAVTTVLKKSEIARKSITELSIMPSGLVDALTPEQIRDLLAFLETGKN